MISLQLGPSKVCDFTCLRHQCRQKANGSRQQCRNDLWLKQAKDLCAFFLSSLTKVLENISFHFFLWEDMSSNLLESFVFWGQVSAFCFVFILRFKKM